MYQERENRASKRSKILFFESRYSALYGAQKSMLTLIEAIQVNSAYSCVLLTTSEGLLSEEARKRNIEVVIIPLNGPANEFGGAVFKGNVVTKVKLLNSLLAFSLRVRSYIKKNQFTILYLNDIRSLLILSPSLPFIKVPKIWYIRDDAKHKFLHKIGIRLSTKIVLIARQLMEVFTEKDQKQFTEKIRVIHTGFEVTPKVFDHTSHIARNLEKTQRLIVVGSITERKGQDLALKALQTLRERDLDVTVEFWGDIPDGSHDYYRSLLKFIGSSNLSDFVLWKGYVKDVSGSLMSDDILLLPSRGEGLPRVILEAFTVGVPAVACDVGGVKDIITNDTLGMVVDKGDHIALAEAISEIIREPIYFDSSARLSRINHVIDNFSINAFRQNFLKLLREIE